jgi:hypothetical protein
LIINEFLNEIIGPGQGRIFTSNPHKFPEYNSSHIKVSLGEFINRPRYQHYPWLSQWNNYINGGTQTTTESPPGKTESRKSMANDAASIPFAL